MLSVIFPASPDCEEFRKYLLSIQETKNVEIIIVELQAAKTRAERLNMGFHRSRGEVVLFHHPRSYIDLSGIRFLAEQGASSKETFIWGGFSHQFDLDNHLLRFTSWYSNNIRPKKGIVYLDHGIFFDRRLWKKDLPAVEIFEDTLLSYEFYKTSKPEILPFKSTTSAIRFKKNGLLKQALLNQLLKIGFHFNLPHSFMNRIYERGLNLNSKL